MSGVLGYLVALMHAGGVPLTCIGLGVTVVFNCIILFSGFLYQIHYLYQKINSILSTLSKRLLYKEMVLS